MPSVVKVRVVAGRNLPEMDRAGNTDGFVEVRFAGREETTQVVRKTLDPVWEQDFRFDVHDDAVLQNEPIVFRVLDADPYGAAGLIGTVHVSLNPLLTREGADDTAGAGRVQGWFPIFDTFEGIRGELNVAVRVQFVEDENPFADSSAGVRFFSSSWLDPNVVAVECVIGFVQDLVVDTDPEFAWADNFRTSRSSNEQRQNLLYRLSAAVRRFVGKKALDMGANAVIGYQHHFDIEGDSGIVSRGYGTAVVISSAVQSWSRSSAAASFPLKRVLLSRDKDNKEHVQVVGSRTASVWTKAVNVRAPVAHPSTSTTQAQAHVPAPQPAASPLLGPVLLSLIHI